MALDRQTIEKRDFPISRRGYEIEAVDAHLQMLADEFESLKRAASRTARTDSSLAQAASEQVKLIVEAAESSAADIEREAELAARQMRQDAREAAERLRNEAGREAREHVERVSEAARSMLERVESMQNELAGLTDSLKSSTTRVNADLSMLQASVSEVRLASTAAAAAGVEAGSRGDDGAPTGSADDEAAISGEVASEPATESANGGADEEGARLIALNMALNGTPREETERYLADNFQLADTQGLLDDVYARAGQ